MLLDLKEGFIGDDDDDDDDGDGSGGGGSSIISGGGNDNSSSSGNSGSPASGGGGCGGSNRAWERHCEKLLRANGTLPLSELFALLRHQVGRYQAVYGASGAAATATAAAATAAVTAAAIPESVPTVCTGLSLKSPPQPPLLLPPPLPPLALPPPWGANPAFEAWVEARQQLLWGGSVGPTGRGGLGGGGGHGVAASGPTPGSEPPSSLGGAGGDSAGGGGSSSSSSGGGGGGVSSGGGLGAAGGATAELEALVAAHSLLEISLALARLAQPPAVDHLFPFAACGGRGDAGDSSSCGCMCASCTAPWAAPEAGAEVAAVAQRSLDLAEAAGAAAWTS